RRGPRPEPRVGRRARRRARRPARGTPRRREPELARRVGVEEPALEAAAREDRGAPRREALAVEGARAEPAGEPPVVEHRHELARDALAKARAEEARLAVDRVAVH